MCSYILSFHLKQSLCTVIMYPSSKNEYEKFSGSSPSPSAPPPPPAFFDQSRVVTGIPVTSTNQFYSPNPPHHVHQTQHRLHSPWSSGLCSCGSDVSNCCITCWCPCITFGLTSEIIDRGSSSCVTNGVLYTLIAYFTGCGCIYSFFYRSKMRHQYNLEESPCGDCLVHCCCELCALCQEYRELKYRGFDMSIGWQANLERQNQGVGLAPVVQDGMNR